MCYMQIKHQMKDDCNDTHSVMAVNSTLANAENLEDPHLWLEEVEDETALKWVQQRNDNTVDQLTKDIDFITLQEKLKTIYDSKDRIPYVGKQGDFYYNFWRDTDHPRGVWRRTNLESYKSENPDWETILDLDALSESENENWVWHGANCLYPAETLCMVALSRGGADADVKREFDVETKTFVENGFVLPGQKVKSVGLMKTPCWSQQILEKEH